ncbi:MAG: C-terminal binding protein [Planctomycetota bacterium]|nr:MAG: C-terminal binding protein [Planctomycetota bacterium]REJ96161.1 MAG: C-terminal binding protein [Planctomycetota bacterium]REK23471.1 MAG: C-terminal binding protein [Planctomycetota bacterium]REK38889.1 MAG: C-terminal binding protein [Planctomycetota bacterium]
MARPRVVVTDFIGGDLEHELNVLGGAAHVEALAAASEQDLQGRIEDADAMMVYHCISIGAETIERLERCKLIVRCGVGYDNVDGAAARRKGIPLANVPDYGTEEVADSAIGMTLSLMRGINFLNRRLQRGRGEWSYTQIRPVHRLRGRVFGIIGLGRIGTAAALRAKALGMDVVYYDPYVPDGRDKSLGVRRVETLEELLGMAHVVSPHCPLTEETRHIIDSSAIAKMRRGGFVVNTSRGGVVDVQAVAEAIVGGQLAGAGIDVLETEPPADDNPLIRAWRDPEHPAHDRVIVNPHTAFYCEEGLEEMRIKGSENCLRVLEGRPPRNVVN